MESRFKIQDLELGEIVISLKVMKISKFLVTAGVSVSGLLVFTTNSYADVYCDSYGTCTGTNSAGERVNTHTDRYGTTTGSIGGSRVNVHKDRYGTTTGSIGGSRVNVHTDRYGTTTGSIGGSRVNCHTDRYGTTSC